MNHIFINALADELEKLARDLTMLLDNSGPDVDKSIDGTIKASEKHRRSSRKKKHRGLLATVGAGGAAALAMKKKRVNVGRALMAATGVGAAYTGTQSVQEGHGRKVNAISKEVKSLRKKYPKADFFQATSNRRGDITHSARGIRYS